jgi:hypothetical protein
MADRPSLRDPRALHDQIIDHGLVNLPAEKLLAILVMEVRRMRVQLATMSNGSAAPRTE